LGAASGKDPGTEYLPLTIRTAPSAKILLLTLIGLEAPGDLETKNRDNEVEQRRGEKA